MLRFILLILFLPFFATAQTTRIDSIFKNAGEVYFWQIISFDNQQNKSESAVFEFQTD